MMVEGYAGIVQNAHGQLRLSSPCGYSTIHIFICDPAMPAQHQEAIVQKSSSLFSRRQETDFSGLQSQTPHHEDWNLTGRGGLSF